MKNKHLFTFITVIIMIFSICTILPIKISVVLQAAAVTDVSNLNPVGSTYTFIKSVEGYSPQCFWDVSQWSIGYGTKCPYTHTSNGTRWHQSGGHSISESEARNLFNSKLSGYVNTLKSNCSGLAMNQNQFDALLSATYNHGNVNTCPLKYYLQGKYTESEAREKYYVWCINAGTADEQGLRNRRKKEADLFFSGASVVCDCSESYAGTYTTYDVQTSLNIRSESSHSTSGSVVGSIPSGAKFTVTKANGSIAHVNYNGTTGIVSMAYIQKAEWYSGLKPENLGDEFDALILNKHYWKPLMIQNSISENSDVVLGTENQSNMSREVWHFKRNSDGSYRIMPLHNWDLSLDTDVNSKRVLIWGNHDGDNQKWFIYQYGERFALRPACSDMALDLSGDNEADGTPIQIWEKNDSGAQVFDVYKFSSPGSAKLTATAGTSSTDTKFSWTKTNDTETYYLKIWKNKAWEGESYKEIKTTDTNLNITLPEGTYQAYIDSCNNYSYTYSNVVTFDVKAATFNVSFNANGGSVSTTNKTVTYNFTYGSLPTPTRTGYTFNGWYTAASGGSKVDANTKVAITANQTLYAQWTAKSVSVKFFRNHDGNDTSSVTETFTYGVSNQKFGYKTDGSGKYIPMNSGNIGFGAWSRTGYEMLGWSADRNATSIQHSTYSGVGNDWINSKYPSINLYAIWRANSYTIAYNSNGGSGSTGNSAMTYDKAANLNSNGFSRTGYTFKGWNIKADGSGTAYADKASVKNLATSGTVTLYAQWTANSYTIAYNSNGGSGSTGNSAMTYDKAANLNSNGFSRTGYTFKGWNTKADGSGTAYADKASVKNLATSGTVTLYAQWTAKSVSVKFFRNHDGNDTSSVTETFTYGVSNQKFGYKTDGTGQHSPMNPANVGFGAWSKTGYEMLGWSSDRNAKSAEYSTYSGVGDGWINSKSPSINLYAVWSAKQYTVTFDTTNGGSVSQASKTITYNSTYGDLPAPTRKGYTFTGWYTEKTGGTKVNADTKVTITANQTLYAQWSATDEVGKVMTEKDAAGQTIPDGDYWIYSGLDRNYYLDTPGSEIATDYSRVQMWMCEDGMPNKYDVWTVKYLDNGFYKITQYGTDMCLEIAGRSNLNGADMQMYKYGTGEWKQWSISRTETGYQLKSRYSGFCLNVADSKVEKGTKLNVSKADNSKAQSFCFIPYTPDERPLADGIYGIQSAKNSEYYVDAAGNTKDFKNGTNICIGDKMYDTFRVEYAGDGWYKIFETTTGLALEVSNPAENHFSDNQRNINLYQSNNYSRGQLWKIRKTSDGHYFIISKLSGYYFDLLNGECVKGQNISQVYYVGGNAQKWNFVSTIIKGDANNDKTVNVADAVMLQKWLLGEGSLTNWKNVDLCEDGRIDVFDMIEMRKLLVQNK